MNELFGILMVICFVVCYIFWIIKILKIKGVVGISVGVYLMVVLGSLFGIFYSFNNEGMVWLFVDSIICLILISIILFLQQKYK